MKIRRSFAIGVGVVAFVLYLWTCAPGLTWAYFGADGGELLAAAMTNGVPHPPGYPLYMLLLQVWLALLGLLLPGSDLAWRGNLLSAFFAALSVTVTFLTCARLLDWMARQGFLGEGEKKITPPTHNLRWALLAALAWMISPLLWSQALITEVYALHILLVSLLGYVILTLWQDEQAQLVAVHSTPARWQWLGLWLLTACGVAHHLTFVLLLPAVLYAGWSTAGAPARRLHIVAYILIALTLGGLTGLLFHLRTWTAAHSGSPVNWGDARQWDGLWWLISGQAYRSYLFAASSSITFDRIAAWAYTLTTQFTPIGLAVLLFGLSHLDRLLPALRNFSLLWLAPISVYSIVYFTKDTEIYLLPVIWLTVLWLAIGLAVAEDWLLRYTFQRNVTNQNVWRQRAWQGLVGLCLIILFAWRYSWISLRQDDEAQRFLREVSQVVTPASIVVSTRDERTFALWYGVWASQELPADLILVNDYLYQFSWYQRTLAQIYPATPEASLSLDSLLVHNRGKRPIFFADGAPEYLPNYASQTIPNGPLLELQ